MDAPVLTAELSAGRAPLPAQAALLLVAVRRPPLAVATSPQAEAAPLARQQTVALPAPPAATTVRAAAPTLGA